jgi:DNA-binding CsgD family transcriptional regulator
MILNHDERAVLNILARGASTVEAGERLGIAPDRVRDRVMAAIEKLGAASKLELVVIAARHGEITFEHDAD